MDTILIDRLAQEIRRVDGSNSLGAAALAEALMPFLAAQSMQAQEGDLLDALRTLHRLGQFDNVYDVRARADLSILRDDQSSWDHPDVIAYSEACKVIESYLAAALPLR